MRTLNMLMLLVAAAAWACDGEQPSAVDSGGPSDGGPADERLPAVDAAIAAAMDVGAAMDGAPADSALPDVGAPDGGERGDDAAADGGDPPGDAAADAAADAALPADAEPPQGDGCGAIIVLEQRCAQGGCHLPNNPRTGLVLTRDAIAAGALQGYVVPRDPAASYLLTRMTDPAAGPLMPMGVISPAPEAEQLEAWIADGAPLRCDALPEPPPLDPNHLDRDALFECGEPAPAATPARIRRVERREWTKAVVKPLAGTWWGSTAKDNPFAAPGRLPYSTYPADVSIDPATLDLYLLVLPEAPATWSARDPQARPALISGTRTEVVYRNRPLWCIYNDAEPDDACIDLFVNTFLRDGVLFRPPTAGEFDRLRAFLAAALADEADPADRGATLQFVGEAAFLTSGALFRSELGQPDPDEPAERRLTPHEMALALGRVLSPHPVGAPLPISWGLPPDADNRMLGRLSLIRAAADDGTIFDPVVISGLLAAYRSGVDPSRADLEGEIDDRRRPRRGEYWLAENIQQFFREWLDYESANTEFKDDPGATSRWDGQFNGDPMWDPTTNGYRNLQSGYYGYEPRLVDHLDDTIARAVIESHAAGDDVFARLMTTRDWRLPSDRADVTNVPCDNNADCVGIVVNGADFDRCSMVGLCGNSINQNTVTGARVYGLDQAVPATPEGRWVTMPEGQRSGVLTHPAWLSAHGRNFEDDANAVHRGKWIRERLFCETVPGLELVQAEAQLVPSEPGMSARARLHRSVEDPEANPQAPTCMGCHTLMNSLGYPFEIYNHAGFVRAFDHGPMGDGPPDGRAVITVPPEAAFDREFADAIELSEALASSPVARRCFIRQVFRYFMGRDETLADACVLAEMETALDDTGSFFAMLEVLAQSHPFQHRAAPEEAAR